MKKVGLILISIWSINMTSQVQENFIQKEINELHKTTKKTQDSVGILIIECNMFLEKSNDSIKNTRI